MVKRVPSVFEKGGTVVGRRVTSAEVYGDRTPPSRKASYSSRYPNRGKKTRLTSGAMAHNPAWRKPLHSTQNPGRKKKKT